jgi:hypothetical protein
LYPRLENHFGRDNIFRDLDTIDYGVDFVKTIEDAVQSCDVLLAVIGPHWVNLTDSQGRRRLDNPNDFVRLEVATALARDIRVIPLLVGGASMPYTDELPDNLKLLTRRNALEIVDRDFDAHVQRLIGAIERAIGQISPPPQPAFSLPMLEWIRIPGGNVKIEKHGSFEVSDFSIAKYPVTVQQYEYFVNDGGYNQRDCWTDVGWAWREKDKIELPVYWNDTKWHIAKHPIVGVSWYESIAFCGWLSDKLGYAVTLPTEMQWQRAAQGDDGRGFSWGDTFDKKYANTVESGIGKTTPVDQYPNGASPYGVMDMSGNVWEWCLNEYGDVAALELSNTAHRVLRGGSWYNSRVDARAVYRRRDYPYNRNFNSGFRVCRPPSL